MEVIVPPVKPPDVATEVTVPSFPKPGNDEIVAFLISLSSSSENQIVSAPTGLAAVAAKIALSVPL